MAFPAGLVLTRPWALTALVLPLLYLLLVLLARRPDPVVIGTFAWWKELPRGIAREGARGRGRWTPATWLTAAALALGALAWSGPRPGAAPGPRRWTCLVDTSASMGLALEGETRQSRALADALGWLNEHAHARDQVLWRTPGRAALLLARGERPDPRWLEPRRAPGGEPDWAGADAPGTLWITDREPAVERRRAGLFASGGDAQPGLVQADGRQEVWWDGAALASRPASTRPTLYLRAPGKRRPPPVLRRLAEAWCAARGFALLEEPRGEVALVLEFPGATVPTAPQELRVARDGWSARARVALSPEAPSGAAPLVDPDGETWLAARLGSREPALVTVRPGRVHVSLVELGEPDGDPLLFALSWGRLLDRAALTLDGVVALEERLEAGPARRAAPEPPAASAEPTGPRPSALEAGLALAAALAGALGVLRGR